MGLAAYAGGVLEQREIRRASDKAAHVPIASASTALVLFGKLRADLLFAGVKAALRVIDVYSEYSLLLPARAKNLQGVWAARRNSRIDRSARPKCDR